MVERSAVNRNVVGSSPTRGAKHNDGSSSTIPTRDNLQRFLNQKRGITKKTNVKRPTVNQVLSKLLELEKVERIGLDRGTRYRIK